MGNPRNSLLERRIVFRCFYILSRKPGKEKHIPGCQAWTDMGQMEGMSVVDDGGLN